MCEQILDKLDDTMIDSDVTRKKILAHKMLKAKKPLMNVDGNK